MRVTTQHVRDCIHENWTWVVGEPNPASSHVMGMTWWSGADIAHCLVEDTDYTTGVISYSSAQEAHSPRGVFSRIGQKGRLVNLQDLWDQGRISPCRDVLDRDLLFIPCDREDFPSTRKHRRLIAWAIENELPYIYHHDNDHVWFSEFPSRAEKLFFQHHLSRSAFRIQPTDIKISTKDWLRIRQGICAHGWTLNSADCTFSRRQIRYVLWGGTPTRSILECLAKVEDVNLRLTLSSDGSTAFSVDISAKKCPHEVERL